MTTRRPSASRSTSTHNVSINAVRACIVAAAHAGLDIAEAVTLVGVTSEALANPEARVPAELAFRAWELIAERLADSHFGLHAAEAMHAMLFDAYDFAVTSATTLREGIESMAKHLRVQHEGAEIRLTVSRGEARVVVRFDVTQCVPRHFCECCIAVWLLRARALLHGPFDPRRVSFRHAAPSDTTEHLRVLGTKPEFSAAEDSVIFDATYLDVPLRSANPALQRIMDSYLDERNASAPADEALEARARTEIQRALRESTPTVGRVAARLGVSVRTLQRALGDAGTSFNTLLDEARRNLAVTWARDPARSFKQIASELGFGRSTAFTRAFRRWTGRAPSAFRAEVLSQSARSSAPPRG